MNPIIIIFKHYNERGYHNGTQGMGRQLLEMLIHGLI